MDNAPFLCASCRDTAQKAQDFILQADGYNPKKISPLQIMERNEMFCRGDVCVVEAPYVTTLIEAYPATSRTSPAHRR